jgi:hypothetical protein
VSASAAKNSWGGIVNLPAEPQHGEKFLRARASSSELERLLTYWENAAAAERPRLCGITANGVAGGAKNLELLFERGSQEPLVLLEISAGGAFPRPSRVFRYGQWWEEELRTFGGIEFGGGNPERGATWRPA